MKKDYQREAEALGWFGIAFFFCLVGLSIVFMGFCAITGMRPLWSVAPAAFVLAGLMTRKNFPQTPGVWVYALAIVVILVALGSITWDFSYDGRTYHLPAIQYYVEGGNYFSMGEPIHNYFWRNFADLWSDAYPKALWLAGAELSKFTGTINSAHTVSLWLSVFMGLYLYAWLRNFCGPKLAGAGAVLLGLNPIIVAQWLINYADGAVAVLAMYIMVAAARMLEGGRKRDRLLFFAASVLIINIKFSCVQYPAVALFVLGLAQLWRKVGFWNIVKHNGQMFLGILGVAFCVLGFNPYMQNIFSGKHIFFPLFGEEARDIMSYNAPILFKDFNYIEKLGWSLFSETDNINEDSKRTPKLKIPGTFSVKELELVADTRIGGLGPWFSLLLLLGVPALLRRRGAQSWLVLGYIVISTLVHPEGWWARYVPQLWALPILAWLTSEERPVARLLQRGLVGLMLLVGFCNAAVPLHTWVNFGVQARQTMTEFKERFNNSALVVTQAKQRFNPIPFLKESGVMFVYIPEQLAEKHGPWTEGYGMLYREEPELKEDIPFVPF